MYSKYLDFFAQDKARSDSEPVLCLPPFTSILRFPLRLVVLPESFGSPSKRLWTNFGLPRPALIDTHGSYCLMCHILPFMSILYLKKAV